MKIVVLGASGLIGSALVARLSADGHEVVAVSRHPRPAPAGRVATVARDIGPGTPAAQWTELLRGADAVVNCAGTLQDAPGESTSGVHAEGLEAVFAACERSVCGVSSTSRRWVSSGNRRLSRAASWRAISG